MVSCAGIRLKEYHGHVIGLRDVELMAQPEISNYLLRARVRRAGTFPFHPDSQAAPFQSQTGSGGTPDRDIRAPRGDSSSGFLGFVFFLLWEKIRVHTNRRCSEAFPFFFFGFLNGPSEKGAGQHSAPPRLCLSQLLGRSTFPQSH